MTLRLSEEEYAELMRRRKTGRATTSSDPPAAVHLPLKGKARKYGNTPVTVDGKRFDSKHEAEVYAELMLRVRAGELKCVARQVSFDLPGGIRYIADFVTIDAENRVEVIDAKSPATRKNRVYINKRKQMRSEWGIEVREV